MMKTAMVQTSIAFLHRLKTRAAEDTWRFFRAVLDAVLSTSRHTAYNYKAYNYNALKMA